MIWTGKKEEDMIGLTFDNLSRSWGRSVHGAVTYISLAVTYISLGLYSERVVQGPLPHSVMKQIMMSLKV